MKKISIVCPICNEEDNLEELLKRIFLAVRRFLPLYDFEIVLVDDGSTDNSNSIMRHLLKKYDFMKMITHPRRMGQTAALSTGFQAATGEIVIIMDGDLQIFPEDIYILINKMAEGYDLVNGMRTERKGVFLLKICSIIFSSAVSIIFNIYIKDMASNFKAFRREFIKNLDLTSNDHRYIIPIVYNRGARKIAEVSVRHAKRVQGKSKYRLSKILAAIPEFFWFYHRYRKGYYDLN